LFAQDTQWDDFLVKWGNNTPDTSKPPSVPQLVYPAHQQTGLGTSVTFAWEKCIDPEGSTVAYDVYLTGGAFTGVDPIKVVSLRRSDFYAGIPLNGTAGYPGLAYMLVALLTVSMAWGLKRRRFMGTWLLIFLAAGILFVSCNNSSSYSSPADQITLQSPVLSPGTIYSWRVVARDSGGSSSTSTTRTFTTAPAK
jgi:hypothetical protein